MKLPVTRDDLRTAESRLMDLKTRYLTEHGWKYTCETPGSTWLWRKVYLEDTYMCNLPMALCIEEALSPK